ncbi:MAG: DUF4968 domain-containing protein [Clostridia bacterium]|nr:DUF4968 domain-containing protein [Clostridia bacterium]
MLIAPHRPARCAQDVSFTPSGVEIRSEYGLTRLSAMNRGILRLRMTRRDAFQDENSPFIVNRESVSAARAYKDEGYAYVETGALTARISLADGALETFDLSGRPLFTEGGLRTLEEYDAFKIDPLAEAETVEVDTADGKKLMVKAAPREKYKKLYRAYLPMKFASGEVITGLGQPDSGPSNLRGRKLYLNQSNRSISVPFLLSSAGWGLLIDCGCLLTFDDTGEECSLRLTGVSELDMYIILGYGEEAVKGLHYLSGRPALLPRWAFGYIQSQERYETQDEIVSLVKSYREKGIGIDCAVLDWMTWPDGMWGQKSFHQTRFSDPRRMTDELHALDAHVLISIWPNPNPRTPDNAEFKAAGLLLPGGGIYNALLPEARRMYWRQAYDGIFQYGLDGWWCDSSEPWTQEWSRKERPSREDVYFETLGIASDAVGADRANTFAFYHAEGIYEGQRATDESKRVINLTRSGWTGQQRFGTILWSGDITAAWKTLKTQIAIGLNICASGFPYWTQDIGGFFVKKGESWYWDGEFENGWDDPEFNELYTRWYQYAAFLPIFRAHGTDVRRELTALKDEYYPAALKYNRLRYRLLPYIYSLAGRVALEGGLMMKPVWFDYPDFADKNDDSAFMLGDDILVCPVTDYKARERRVSLPGGIWHRLGGKALEGGRVLSADAPLDDMPVFIRAGAIIPAAENALSAREAFASSPRLHVFAGADGRLDYYSDSGDGYGYEKGEYCIKTYFWNDKAQTLTDSEGHKVDAVIHAL